MKHICVYVHFLLPLAAAVTIACGSPNGGASASEECIDYLTANGLFRLSIEGDPLSDAVSAKAVSEFTEDEIRELYWGLSEINYKRAAQSPECGGFIGAVNEWEATDAGREWFAKEGEWLAGLIFNTKVAPPPQGNERPLHKDYAGCVSSCGSEPSVPNFTGH